MRIVVLLLILLTSPAFAQNSYFNARFGYSVAVPAPFIAQGESDNGDGQAFVVPGKPIKLLVWGGLLFGDFAAEVDMRMRSDAEAGWNMVYQSITPSWASYSSSQGSRILYQRLVMLCDGESYAAFRAEYSTIDAGEMNQVVEQLVQSLRAEGC